MAQNNWNTADEASAAAHRNRTFTRRTYVRSIAAAATATAGVSSLGAVSATDDSYEVIEANNQTIQVGSGETWENKLIDMTTGQDIIVVAHGTDWAIRNVGFEGENTSGAGSATFGISDTGGQTSTIENVYLGDGSDSANASNTGHGQTAFWVSPEHSGHIDFQRLNVQGFADNAIYASAPGGAGGGTVHIDSCFAANCYVSHYRIATEGSKVTNSSVYVDEDGYDGRGVWVWAPGTCEIDGCQLEMNGANYAIEAGASGTATTAVVTDTDYDPDFNGGVRETDGATIDLSSDVGTNPEAVIPRGVPTSAEEAASGDS